MKKNNNFKNSLLSVGNAMPKKGPEGYPVYPESEDIYYRFRKEKSIDPEYIATFKEKENSGIIIDNEFIDEFMEREPDVPEMELYENDEIALSELDDSINISLESDDYNEHEVDLVNG